MAHFNIVSGFSQNPRYDFFVYARGYQEAAVILTNDFINRDSYNDSNGYPIVFLFRHSLELYLKGIIYNGAKLASYQNIEQIDAILNNPKKNKTHDLISLEGKCTKLLKEIFPEDSAIKKLCDELEAICTKIGGLDKDSYSYRYPIDNSGNHSTLRNQIVDIQSFGNEVNEILERLYILAFGINLSTDTITRILDEIINE